MNHYITAIFLFIFSISTAAQNFSNLVFEGAGIRGIAYAGAIKELEQQNILSGVTSVGGTSAGAIAALTLALGYDAEDIESIISKLKFQKFNDGQFLFIGGLSIPTIIFI